MMETGKRNLRTGDVLEEESLFGKKKRLSTFATVNEICIEQTSYLKN